MMLKSRSLHGQSLGDLGQLLFAHAEVADTLPGVDINTQIIQEPLSLRPRFGPIDSPERFALG